MPNKKAKLPLSKTHPKLAKEAYGWDPDTIFAKSNKKLEWICSKEHIWSTKVYHRTSGSNCPYCYGRLALPGVTDLLTTDPDLARELVDTDPTTIKSASHKKVNWKCSSGHIWKASVKSRGIGSKSGCPYCANLKVMAGFNDLATTNPELAAEAFGWDPKTIIAGHSKKMNWKCFNGHIWKISSAARMRGDGCPFCSGRNAIPGETDLLSINPDLASELMDADPSTVTRHSGRRHKWRCKLGHEYSATPASRRKNDAGCPYCANKKTLAGFNDLVTTNPELAAEAFGWDPSSTTFGSSRTRWWKCTNDHQYQASVNSRSHMKSGCPYCANQRVLAGFNDLATTNPELAAEAFGWDPSKVIGSGRHKMKWKCPSGHIYNAPVGQRKTRNSEGEGGCPVCAGREVLSGFNDIQTTFPQIAIEDFGWDPKTVTFGSAKQKMWKCRFGHKWRTSTVSRTRMKSGCPTCSTGGYDPNEDAYLYFIQHSDWEMLQIGITNTPDDRLKDHEKLGWKVLEYRGPMDGHLTQQWETAILRMLKAKGADLANSKIAGKFDGYSEAWSKSTFPVKSIKELMRLTEDFEEGR